MENLSNNRIFRQSLVLLQLLLITKVYDVLATPLPAESATYSKTAATNRSEPSKTSNYFLHQPYGPNTYAFGYQVEDLQTGNVQFRDERRYLNGSIVGSFGYVRPDDHIQVTRYKADADGGYLAHSQSYAPGEQQEETIWPTKLPHLLKDLHKQQPAVNVSWDPKQHLNVSVDEVEDEVAEHLKQQLGLDLFNIDVTHDVQQQPAVLDIVNGKTPLKQQPNGSLAFETLEKVVPHELPLVPFELPAQELAARATAARPAAEKAAPQIADSDSGATEIANELLPPRPLVNSASNASTWYKQIIEANRREFLEHLPNLNKVNV